MTNDELLIGPYSCVISDCLKNDRPILGDIPNVKSLRSLKNKLTLICWNVQGILNKLDNIDVLNVDLNCDVLCVTEHWLNNTEMSFLSLPGYINASQFCRTNKTRGGSVIFVKNYMQTKDCTQLTGLAEELIFEISAVSLPILKTVIVCVYRPPTGDITIFLNKLHDVLSVVHAMSYELILSGDFNLNFLLPTREVMEISNITKSFGLEMCIKGITRPNLRDLNCGTCIDNVFTSFHPETWSAWIIHVGVSDHNAIILETSVDLLRCPDKPSSKSLIRPMSPNNGSLFLYYLNKIDWIDVYSLDADVNIKFELFLNMFLWALDSSSALKTVKSKPNNKHTSWYTDNLCRLKEQLDNLYYILTSSGSEHSKELYMEAKRNYRFQLRNAKQIHNNNFIVNSTNRTKAAWQIINSNKNNKPCVNDGLSSNDFNNYFTDCVESISNNIFQSNYSHNYYLCNNDRSAINSENTPIRPSFSLSEFKVEEVYMAINSLKDSKCLDVYGINAYMLKLASSHICEVLTYIFNNCIKQAIFPDKLKFVKVIPVHKKGDKGKYENYRPISIVPVLSKVLERLLNKQITLYLETNNIFTPSQFGFRTNHNTVEAVQTLISECLDGLENRNNVLFRSFDLSKAFDTVDHCVLLDKMSYYLFDNVAVNLFRSYLTGRRQTVYLNGTFSSTRLVKHGVPQGSILGPTLFLMYINDLPSSLNCVDVRSILFADDLGLCVQNKNLASAQNVLNFKTDVIADWCRANRLKLNDDKVQNLNFKLASANNFCSPLKFLGIMVQANLKWHSHIDFVSNKLSKGLFMLRSLKGSVTLDILIYIYYAHIHSHLSYGTAIWANVGYAEKLFILQKRAVRLICGIPQGTHCGPYFVNLKILTLPSLYVLSTLMFIKSSLSSLVINSDVHLHNTRQAQNLRVQHCNYTTTQMSFLNQGKMFFNCLPEHVKTLPISRFRNVLKKFLLKACLYNINDFIVVVKNTNRLGL